MKINYHYILLLVLGSIAFSCKKDNYEPPTSKLTGRLVHNGEPIQVESGRVPFELYEYGFGKVGPINGTFAQDGTFSHLLFDGDYKFVIRPGQGPFLWPETGGKSDSISINVQGSKNMDIEVRPYYMIRTPQITKAGNNVAATFRAEKIIMDPTDAKNIERVNLYINRTQFVSGTDNIARAEMGGGAIADPSNISLSVAVPTITPTQNYVFARIGLKVAGVEDMIFSPVQKINL